MEVSFSLVESGVLSNDDFTRINKIKSIIQAYSDPQNNVYWKYGYQHSKKGTGKELILVLFTQEKEKKFYLNFLMSFNHTQKTIICGLTVKKIITEKEVKEILGITK